MSGPACICAINWVCSLKRRSIAVISAVAASILPASSLLVAWVLTLRSPRATAWMACTALPNGPVTAREMTVASAAATNESSTMQLTIAIMLVRWVALASAILPSICPAMWVPSAFIAANRSRRAGRDCSSEICWAWAPSPAATASRIALLAAK